MNFPNSKVCLIGEWSIERARSISSIFQVIKHKSAWVRDYTKLVYARRILYMKFMLYTGAGCSRADLLNPGLAGRHSKLPRSLCVNLEIFFDFFQKSYSLDHQKFNFLNFEINRRAEIPK